MTARDLVIAQTQDALRLCLKTAASMPEDKLSWQPLDQGRTALDQLAECLQAAHWFNRLLKEKNGSFFGPKFMAAARTERAKYTTLAQVQEEIEPAYEALFETIRGLTDEEAAEVIELAPGWNASLLEVCWFPMRNLYYHFGQINYIQTLYGDSKMH
jgi:hypothetical protein